jgi:hypothetical protein
LRWARASSLLFLACLVAPVETAAQDSAVADSTFAWLRGARIEIAYRGADSLRAENLLEFLEGLPPLPGLPPTVPAAVTVVVAPTDSAFTALAGGAVPEWGAAVALPILNRMVLPREGGRRVRGWTEARVLQHEWAHLGLHQFLPGMRVPRWFDEGYAEWASGGWSPTQGWRLRVAFALGQAPALDSLVLSWPRDRTSAELAYLLSATAVEYLVRESGERGLRLFLEAWREEGSFSAALRRVYGVTPGQFEEDWKKYVRRRYGWLFALSHSTVFWLTLALALLVLVRIRRGRDREAMARLRATEPPDQPAFWQEEGEGGEGGQGTNPGPEQSSEGTAQSKES